MRNLCLAPVVIVAFLFAGCSSVTAGEVYNKEYEPARDWTTTEPTYQYLCYPQIKPDGSMGQDCQNRLVGYHDEHHHEDECYRVDFKNEEGDKGNDCVSESEYNDIEEGDWYDEEEEDF